MINIAICDDSRNDIKDIQEYVAEHMREKGIPFQIHIFLSGDALLKKGNAFEIVFLDISMTGMNGIEVGEKLKRINREIKIIYITSFSEYWVQAVNHVHAFAYLKKPVNARDITAQIDEILCTRNNKMQENQVVSFEVFTIKNGCKIDSLFMNFNVNDLYYFEYVGRKIILKTKIGEYFFVGQMKNVIQKMEKYRFACCHRSFLVNLQYVQSIKGYDLYMRNGDKLPVSQKKSAEFRNKMNEFIQKNI